MRLPSELVRAIIEAAGEPPLSMRAASRTLHDVAMATPAPFLAMLSDPSLAADAGSPRSVSVAAMREQIYSRMPTPDDIQEIRNEQSSLVYAERSLRATRERLLFQLSVEQDRVTEKRDKVRRDLRSSLLKRFLVRRVGDRCRRAFFG